MKVEAGYSKHRREDLVPLHPEVANWLTAWVEEKGIDSKTILFPVANRKTAKMMKQDLGAARKVWINEASDEGERKRREETDFLKYENDAGLYADFHSNRHTFLTALGRMGVSPKVAQTLARHSDVKLTMGIYTHAGIHDLAGAIETLPGPRAHQSEANQPADEAVAMKAMGTTGKGEPQTTQKADRVAPYVAPNLCNEGQIVQAYTKVGQWRVVKGSRRKCLLFQH